MGLPNADKVDQEELAKLRDIVTSTKTALDDQVFVCDPSDHAFEPPMHTMA